MMNQQWLIDEARLTVAIALASLIANGVRLVFVKAFLEPAAAWIGRYAYRRVDELSGDRLPDWFEGKESAEAPDR